ncbi:hypothetical protein SESBI_35753 [Sesbania bispinosa]|nr:hypothetical protein SESBI_35753 [Sesbania bispinosa]
MNPVAHPIIPIPVVGISASILDPENSLVVFLDRVPLCPFAFTIMGGKIGVVHGE